MREGEREIRLEGLIGDGNNKSNVGRSREAAAAETAATKAVEVVVVATAKASATAAAAVEAVVVATAEALATAVAVELTAMRD